MTTIKEATSSHSSCWEVTKMYLCYALFVVLHKRPNALLQFSNQKPSSLPRHSQVRLN